METFGNEPARRSTRSTEAVSLFSFPPDHRTSAAWTKDSRERSKNRQWVRKSRCGEADTGEKDRKVVENSEMKKNVEKKNEKKKEDGVKKAKKQKESREKRKGRREKAATKERRQSCTCC